MQVKLKCNVDSLPKPKPYRKVGEHPPSGDGRKDSAGQLIHRRSRSYTAAQDAVIIQMRMEGKSYAEIADEVGKSKEAVRRRWYALKGFV